MFDSEALLKELLETFRMEAQDHIRALTSLLIELEKESDPAGRRLLVETVFRRMHTLKGAAHAVNLVEVAHSCQELESLLADLKRGDIPLELGLFDRLHTDVDALSDQIFRHQQGAGSGAGAAAESPAGCAAQERELPSPSLPGHSVQLPAAGLPGGKSADGDQAPDKGSVPAGWASPAVPPSPLPAKTDAARPGADAGDTDQSGAAGSSGASDAADIVEPHDADRRGIEGRRGAETVRVSTRLLESLLLQAEELVSAKLAASVLHDELTAAAAELAGRGSGRSRAVDLARETLRKAPDAQCARLAALVQESCQGELQTESRLRSLEKSAEKHHWALRGMVDPLLEDMKKLHLLPFSSLTAPFSKLVRDLARELDKEAELSCFGGEIEIDRRILAELKEPLLHIVRNVMDHGIEKAPDRLLAGKPARGRISIGIRLQDANQAELLVSDDGRGINVAQVKGAALRLELLTPETLERISDQEALQFIFESGISTSRIITSLSGRGVGLAIVRESLERLGGHVTVDSRPGEGTEFRLCLPLSFAMMRGLLVQSTGRACMLPAANVEATTRISLTEIRRVENRDTVVIGGEVISLVSLARLLELDDRGAENPDGFQPVVLLNLAEKRIAFAVDQVAGVMEILVKPLGSQLSRVRNVSGATVLGDGRVVPILNIGDLFRSALLGAGSSAPQQSARPKPKRLSVLVAEDSITSRTLLKNILEASGFLVRTAIDGADALSQVKTESFDVVISDVEMPRMDGFELTAAIRGDSRLAALPVILVTGLESRSDRERGIDVGANAYIVKSSFDQGSLLEVIEKVT
ncbi:MAG: hybrid sensor histidine kinase/response regulator [Geobacteraceae bacterium GWC2_58_44]|nr:MAG: hybrid sensor histidine kinase/response regulator [Geobacteraceae bacterium GWC2_58_44]HBG04431.1 hybrid sensor histidine kinase/response regulator [Geobacter sp.]